MKQNSIGWSVAISLAIIAIMAGSWLVTSGYASALVGDTSADASVEVTGATKQTESPLVSPLGNAAGGVVDAKSMTVAQVVAALDGSAQFQALVAQTGVSLASSNSISVFVPTDGAFSQLPKGTISSMTAAEKKALVGQHIVARALDTDAIVAGTVDTMAGAALNFNFGANKISMVGNAIVITQYNCKNGVVYTIDNVLLPPKR